MKKNALSFEANLSLAEKSLPTLVYNCALLERVPVTHSQVITLLQGQSVSGVRVDDLQKVLNLIYAWKYMLDNISIPLDLTFIKNVNRFVAYNESIEWGVLRWGQVGITGTNYKPPIPNENEVEVIIRKFFFKERNIDGAISFMLWAMKSQLFWDGNKRTSVINANKFLIMNGLGIVTFPKELLEEFNKTLSYYYQFNDKRGLEELIKNRCIFINFLE
ncbi:hypothetical protein [Halobacillus sp. H74]|uniref:hypothetical protein n=1 Tax=Halobacillus sp. H74 TaxID=3457436 RepID=UPI003FCDA188